MPQVATDVNPSTSDIVREEHAVQDALRQTIAECEEAIRESDARIRAAQ
jgi:hypothetical protein